MVTRRLVLIVACACGLLLGTPQSLSAQSFFGDLFDAVGEAFGVENADGEEARVLNPGAPAPDRPAMPKEEEINEVKADFVNEFTPAMKQVLTVELYFVRKVTLPTPEQLALIKAAGELETARIAKRYEIMQRQGNATGDWPDGRKLLTDVLAAKVEEHVSVDMATLYREEIAARQGAQQSAARGMMLNLLDGKMLLTTQQAQRVDGVLQQNWNPAWSRNPMLYAYADYVALPDINLFAEHLDAAQIDLMNVNRNHGTISFGWATDLGLTPWENVGFGGNMVPLEEWTGPAEGAQEAATQEGTP